MEFEGIRCAQCDDTGRVLKLANGRQCPWFAGWQYAISIKAKTAPCPHTPAGTWGTIKERARALEVLAQKGSIKLVEGFSLSKR